jgi:hypothetical protein
MKREHRSSRPGSEALLCAWCGNRGRRRGGKVPVRLSANGLTLSVRSPRSAPTSVFTLSSAMTVFSLLSSAHRRHQTSGNPYLFHCRWHRRGLGRVFEWASMHWSDHGYSTRQVNERRLGYRPHSNRWPSRPRLAGSATDPASSVSRSAYESWSKATTPCTSAANGARSSGACRIAARARDSARTPILLAQRFQVATCGGGFGEWFGAALRIHATRCKPIGQRSRWLIISVCPIEAS